MKKKMFFLLFACCFFAAQSPMGAGASGQPAGNDVIKNLMYSMQLELQSSGQAGGIGGVIASETNQLLDKLAEALEQDDSEAIKKAVKGYAEKITIVQAEAFDLLCALPLVLSMAGNISGMLGVVGGGGDPLCLVINLTNIAADIISDIQTYNICVIDNSESPDNATRQQIAGKQAVVNTYSFITSTLDVFLCQAAIEPADFIKLFFEFIAIFPKPATPAAAY